MDTIWGFGFQVSGVRSENTRAGLTPDTWMPVSNFHAIPRYLKVHSHFIKLNDEVCI
ncbi:MAG: hypothetical protein JRD05_05485 [Deltaproteobacteria bacterium]|nr:hypothetical protein [Deltaproteobacteria bacterium]